MKSVEAVRMPFIPLSPCGAASMRRAVSDRAHEGMGMTHRVLACLTMMSLLVAVPLPACAGVQDAAPPTASLH